MERQQRPRVVSSHARAGRLPKTFERSGARLLIVDRDPRDALVSTFFRLKRLGQKLRALECHDARLGAAADACEKLTLETVFDDFNAGGADLALDFDQEAAVPASAVWPPGAAAAAPARDDAAAAADDDAGLEYGDYYDWHADHGKVADALGEEPCGDHAFKRESGRILGDARVRS